MFTRRPERAALRTRTRDLDIGVLTPVLLLALPLALPFNLAVKPPPELRGTKESLFYRD